MKKAFVSCDAARILENHCSVQPLSLMPYSSLDTPVQSHADMLVFIMEGKIFTYKEYYEQNKKVFDEAKKEGYELVFVSKICGREYPNDIALNVLRVGKLLFSNLKHTAVEILEYAGECDYRLVNVKQGYSACSTLVLNESTIITADKSIYDASLRNGIDALLVESGGITLEGYDYGFIGGASFVIDKNVYFLGEIKNHPSYEKIKDKIKSVGMEIFEIMSGNVCDFGGIRQI